MDIKKIYLLAVIFGTVLPWLLFGGFFAANGADNVDNWWLVVPSGCFVGLSLALPLDLYIREGRASPLPQ